MLILMTLKICYFCLKTFQAFRLKSLLSRPSLLVTQFSDLMFPNGPVAETSFLSQFTFTLKLPFINAHIILSIYYAYIMLITMNTFPWQEQKRSQNSPNRTGKKSMLSSFTHFFFFFVKVVI